jgi:3-deoxy-manno-octulosonate cytidylyltransferase (CMP-KDO synthetase)
MKKDTLIAIPARMKSSRFPGKPLALIAGKPMIYHVIDRCRETKLPFPIYVCTDSTEIFDMVESYGVNGFMTQEHPTGSDRIAEMANVIGAEFVINVQGDEPIINPLDIIKTYDFLVSSEHSVVTGFSSLIDTKDFNDVNTIKIVKDNFDTLLYVSRAAIPGKKVGAAEGKAYRQICLYGYTASVLKDFAKFNRGSLELSEDHELLRFLENGIDVGLVELSDASIPVDLPSDLLLVEAAMKNRPLY